ncbi:helix-turn-helix domain-containing protein [Pedobacter miscanthi]|uniref:helix-turn-helix domain-containing protein n=1 Tax=Pedobacter miscanthi TaxID=2259170 RepID=UPI0039773672
MVKDERLIILGKHIRVIRLSKKLTQKQLAHSVNKDQQSINRLESGGVNPSYLYLVSIAEGLEIDIQTLLNISET